MKKLTFIPLLLLVLAACKKEYTVENITDSNYIKTLDLEVINEDELILRGEIVSGEVSEFGFVIEYSSQSPFAGASNRIVVQSAPFSSKFDAIYPDMTYSFRAYGKINGQFYYGKTVRHTTSARGTWKRMNNFPGPARKFPVSFAVNGKGYMGCGYGASGNLNDMWEFDPATDTWTQIANYPGQPMNSGFSFAIGNKAYVGGGAYGTPPYQNYGGYASFYEFDPVTKNWTKLNDIPISPTGGGMYGAFSFAAGGYGFVGGGGFGGYPVGLIFKYDPVAKTWENYSELPKFFQNQLTYFLYGASFVLGNLAYIGTGFSDFYMDERPNYLFSWNYQTKDWKFIGYVPGHETSFGIGSANGNAGYMGTGERSNDIYQFKPSATGPLWKQVTRNQDYYGCVGGICFTIGNKTYIGLGDPVLPTLHEPNRVYEYTYTR